MAEQSLKDIVRKAGTWTGPIAAIFVEDDVLIEETLRHHIALGFRTLLVLTPEPLDLAQDVKDHVIPVRLVQDTPGSVANAVELIGRHIGQKWLFWCFNAEFLFFPFCETRSIAGLLAFHAGEQRRSMPALVVDLYARDLTKDADGASLSDAWLDGAGYCAEYPSGSDGNLRPQIYGGLRRRYVEFVPLQNRRIDRFPILRGDSTLRLDPLARPVCQDLTTWQSPWHRNTTAAICSFRAAKALRRNPGSWAAIQSFHWRGSVRFDWTSDQLLALGMMESGQWF